jgi:hypothetical protein
MFFTGCFSILGTSIGAISDSNQSKICASDENPIIPAECRERDPRQHTKTGAVVGILLDLAAIAAGIIAIEAAADEIPGDFIWPCGESCRNY